jgi:probable HAF family extracellular repeat protein/autotransporter-associated beta strand protein
LGGSQSTATGVSADGSVVVGGSLTTGNTAQHAFRWTSAGMVDLGTLGGTNSYAYGVSADGSVVVGSSSAAGSSSSRAARWTPSTGIQSIQDILTAHHVDLTGLTLAEGRAVSADGMTIVGRALDASGHYQAYTVQIPLDAFALLDLAGSNRSIGSLIWSGRVTNSGASPATLTAGSDNSNTTFDGVIEDGAGTTALTKVGSGTLVLSGLNTYTGATLVSGGILEVDGSIAPSSLTTVAANATLTGTGSVGSTQINAGGTFAPGMIAAPGTSTTIAGNLAFASGALYLVFINPETSSFANVTGTATLNGLVGANFASGNYVAKQYTILTAASGVSGTFAGLDSLGLPSDFKTSLSYDATHAYLDLVLNFVPPSGALNTNQQHVASAIINFFNTNGSIPLVFGSLTPAGLTQLSGEGATASQQTTFDAMSQFMGLLTDPFISGRGDLISAGGGPTPYVEETPAYAAKRKTDAFAMFTKAPPQTFAQRWSVWAAGFGGSQTTSGNAVLGSNDMRSSIYGTAVGADYIFSPRTIAGFALAGGGTGFSVANGGSGRSDLFQAGAFVRHTVGQAYISGALAYGWQDVTTDRTVTIAGIDHLRAEFNANAVSGRAEAGYRFVSPWTGGIGITPYAAAQFTTFDLPAYAEQVVSGANTFALAYDSRSVTATRSELGLRADKSFAMSNAILTLRGRAAWAHDFNPDRAVGATFQTLPGASFVVNGARQASDAALTTAAAELKWMNGWSVAGTFEGEFSDVTRSYAGKGVVRYQW